MRFQVERDVLAEAVAWAARSLPARPPVPVLAGLMLDASDSTLTLSSFDYDVSARVGVEATITEPGRVLVSGRLLAEITKSLPAQPVDMVGEGSRVVLTCGSARFTLPTLPVEEYPELPQIPTATGTIGSDVFASAVQQVAIAAGRDDTLPVLTGVRVEIEGDQLTLAVTDRYRLAVRELQWQPEQPGISTVALVPARALAETAKSLTSGAQVTIALSSVGTGEGLIGFSGGGGAGMRRTTSRLLDGEFPKYRSLFPSEIASSAYVDTAVLVEAVKRVSLVAPRNTPVRLTFTDGQVVLEAGAGDEAQASETVAARFDGDELSIAFNPGYLLDGLSVLDSDMACLDFTTALKPAVLRSGKGTSGDDYRYLIMPIRLSS